ncbi:MAG: aminotransferase class III-fold pyridoxal phosphate-dependent enzyme [Nocardioidaceae bacterium]
MQDPSRIDSPTRALIERRSAVLGPAYHLQYRRPVNPVRALGTKIWDASGEVLLDAYNNVPSVGHGNPLVVQAMSEQLSTISTNTRYLQRKVVEYAEALLDTFDPELNRVMFTCTGSEANDLALRIARDITGHTGVIASEFAYHGNTSAVASVSPSAGPTIPLGRDVRLIPPPDSHRGGPDVSGWLASRVQEQIDDLNRHGVGLSAFIVDGLFSSDGIYPADNGVLQPVFDVVHRAGGLFILDEVQTGFARTGDHMWGHQRFGITPDLVTLGKPMANGLPVAALVAQWDLLEDFGARIPYFNTFGGNTGCIAAAQAVLQVIQEERLLDNVRMQGKALREGIAHELRGARHDVDVRGCGTYIGVGFSEAGKPAPAIAASIVDAMRDDGVLISLAGPIGNVVKIRPPLVFDDADTDRFLSSFGRAARTCAV